MDSQPNGGEYKKSYCPHCKAIRQIRRDEFEAGIVDLVCEVYYSIIATLYK